MEAFEGSIWVPESEIREYRLKGKVAQRLEVVGVDGFTMLVRLSLTVPNVGKLLPAALVESAETRTIAV